ncbi:MAG TPA: PAS domain-containing hybrid sensor histidine kinase/response regulator [Nannocystis exedens]|nr:PAS domain-containing hybrid sensor histidine kinase/response regulator [Nannocystis exedens]
MADSQMGRGIASEQARGSEAAQKLRQLRAELQQLRRSELRLREAVASVADLVAQVRGDCVLLNRAGQLMLGYEGSEVSLELQIEDLLVPAHARSLRVAMATAQLPSDGWPGGICLLRRDGTLADLRPQIRSFAQVDGGLEFVLVARPASSAEGVDNEGKRLLARLRSLTAVLENTSDFVALADTSGQILYVNPAGMALVGRAGEDPLALRVADLQAPRDYEHLITEIFPFVREHGSWLGELKLWHADGSEIPVSQVITVVRDERGSHVGFATISRDITELKRSEVERHKAVEAAVAANRAKTIFLANMSHELRTPLNAILGFAQLMIRAEGLSSEHRGHIEVINRSGEHLLSLINDVLEMSTIEAGRLTLHERCFDPRRLLEDLADMLRLRVEEKGLSFALEIEPTVPYALRGDPSKIRQVVLNLLSNAIKFTDVGGVQLRAGLRDQASDLRLWVAVEDSGRGIAADELPRLFRPFEQTRSGLASEGGTGLGLTISRHFVRMMKGEIEVRSEPGVGSCFSFEVAVRLSLTDSGRCPSEPDRRVVALAPGEPRWRLLIAEDRQQNRELLRSLLEPVGFEIREAENGEQAVAIAAEWAPHLIWMDVRMPVMDGVEATQRIKALPGGEAIVVIAISANVLGGGRERMIAAGCVDFVAKPFRVQVLFDLLSRYLGCTYVEVASPAMRADRGEPGLS